MNIKQIALVAFVIVVGASKGYASNNQHIYMYQYSQNQNVEDCHPSYHTLNTQTNGQIQTTDTKKQKEDARLREILRAMIEGAGKDHTGERK